MPTDPILVYNFYDDYLWLAEDFTGFQAGILASIESGRESEGLRSGLRVIPNGGLTVTVKAGVACGPNGRLMVLPSDTQVSITAPVGNPAKTYLVLRQVTTDSNEITRPTAPFDQVPLTESRTATVVQLNGIPSPSPVYPSLQAGDIVLMGFILSAGQSVIDGDSFDGVNRSAPVQRQKKITRVSSDYAIQIEDNIVEVAATGGPVSLTTPDPASGYGNEWSVIKIDGTANAVNLSGPISGESGVQLTDQYDFITFYANGKFLNQKA